MNFHFDDFVAFVTINLQISNYFVISCYCNSLVKRLQASSSEPLDREVQS